MAPDREQRLGKLASRTRRTTNRAVIASGVAANAVLDFGHLGIRDQLAGIRISHRAGVLHRRHASSWMAAIAARRALRAIAKENWAPWPHTRRRCCANHRPNRPAPGSGRGAGLAGGVDRLGDHAPRAPREPARPARPASRRAPVPSSGCRTSWPAGTVPRRICLPAILVWPYGRPVWPARTPGAAASRCR